MDAGEKFSHDDTWDSSVLLSLRTVPACHRIPQSCNQAAPPLLWKLDLCLGIPRPSPAIVATYKSKSKSIRFCSVFWPQLEEKTLKRRAIWHLSGGSSSPLLSRKLPMLPVPTWAWPYQDKTHTNSWSSRNLESLNPNITVITQKELRKWISGFQNISADTIPHKSSSHRI